MDNLWQVGKLYKMIVVDGRYLFDTLVHINTFLRCGGNVYIDPEVSSKEILTVKQLNSNEEKDLTEGDWTVSFNRSRTVVGTGDNGKRK